MRPAARLAILVFGILAGVVPSTAAFAYWASAGSGTASAATAGLNPPTQVVASSPGSGVVNISWTGVPASGGVVVSGYFVQRGTTYVCGTGGPPAPGLSPAATTCQDTNVAKGTYVYTVTAIFRSWTAVASAAPVTLTAGPAAKLAFSTQPAGATGGVAFTTQPVVTIQDVAGNTVTSDTSAVTLAIAAGTGTAGASLACATNPQAAVAGVVSFTGCAINTDGINFELRAIDGLLVASESAGFDVTQSQPTITSATPGTAARNTTLDVVVSGTNFAPGAVVSFVDHAGMTVNSTTFNSPASLTVNITTPKKGSAAGTYSVKVLNPDGGTVTLVGAFTVA